MEPEFLTKVPGRGIIVRYVDAYWELVDTKWTESRLVFRLVPDPPTGGFSKWHVKYTRFSPMHNRLYDDSNPSRTSIPIEWITQSVMKRAWIFTDPLSRKDDTVEIPINWVLETK